MRGLYHFEFTKFNLTFQLKQFMKAIKENITNYFGLSTIVIHAIVTIFVIAIAYERQQLNLESQLTNIENSSKLEISTLKNYVDININNLNYKISQEQTNSDRIYQLQIQQNKDINIKLDTIDNRLDKMFSGK